MPPDDLEHVGEEEQTEVDAAWEAELCCRSAEIESGLVIGKPAAQVFAELCEKYSRMNR
jgi:hypothetical protein